MARKVLPLPQKIAVVEWLKKNLDALKTQSSTQAAIDLKADTGIEISGANLYQMAEVMNLNLFRRGSKVLEHFNPRASHDVASVLAQGILELAEKLGYTLTVDARLRMVSRRYLNPPDTKESTGDDAAT